MKRRDILKVILKSSIFFTLSHSLAFSQLKKKLKNDEDWKKVLTPEQFNILRREGTEKPFSSILNNEYRDGDYVCVACNTKLFHVISILAHQTTQQDYALNLMLHLLLHGKQMMEKI